MIKLSDEVIDTYKARIQEATGHVTPICTWRESEDSTYWTTGCGPQWHTLHGNPMKFCPFCGARLADDRLVEE